MSDNLAAVCIVVVLCFAVGSCSWMGVENSRVQYQAKQSCWDNGGNWNGWTNQCDRLPTPPTVAEGE